MGPVEKAVVAKPVHSQRRLSIGRRLHHPSAPGAQAGKDAEGEAGRGLPPQEPREAGWHFGEHVFAQQADQPVHVCCLERLYITIQELPQFGVGRVEQLVFFRGQLVELSPGPLEGAVHGGRARVKQLGHLGRPPRQHFAEEQDRSLLGRQVLQSGHKGQPYAVSFDGQAGGVSGQ